MAIDAVWSPWRIWRLLCLLFISLAAAEQETEANENDPGLYRLVTRPDIRATKWNVTVYHPDRLAPGYWFVGPYRILTGDNTNNGWVGAHIYDGQGELVWSGHDKFSKGNVEDFRVSNVRGQYLMTLMDQGPSAVVVMNHRYEIIEQQHFEGFNSHELNFIQDGTRALIIRANRGRASREASEQVGFDGECLVQFEKFEERDVANNWEVLFEWTSKGRLGLDESTIHDAPVENRCTGSPWDYLHSNSVDKTDDGDYLLSGRHTDTIYKINGRTGDIIWRLGGVKSDFPIDVDLKFTRQHDVRFRGQNETHILLSFLDNAKGKDHTSPPSHEFSRGLLLAVNEKDMVVTIEKQIDHPYTADRYSWRRGNYQVLPNGNIFMGWSEQGVQSEHSADGTILMEATFAVRWLGTYRQYKFPFVGDPQDPPDVVSQATGHGNGSASTTVWVSWNGATEVRSWHLYKTTRTGDVTVLLAKTEKKGFETNITADGFADRVMLVGLDKDGNVLGTSKIIKTSSHNISAELIAAEKMWAKTAQASGPSGVGSTLSTFGNPISTFMFGFICSAIILLVGSCLWRRGGVRMARRSRYYRVQQEHFEPFEDSDENSLPLQASSKESLDER